MQLWTARGAHIALNGVKIRTLSLDPVVVEVRVKTTAPGTVRLTVDDLPAVQQESDGEAVFTLTLDTPAFGHLKRQTCTPAASALPMMR